MTSMHPHWQATDDEQTVSVPVDSLSAAPQVSQPTVIRTASRKPAAIVGILVTLGFGYAAFGGPLMLPGQVASPALTIRLLADGAQPASLTVTPGATVEWKNEDSIPHVLSFDELVVNGKPMETPPIFPGSTSRMLIPATAKAGTYEYVSKTSDLSGEIVIQNADASSKSSVAKSTASASSKAAATVSSAASSKNTLAATAVLPVNTHTVGSPNQKPVEPLHTGAPLRPVTTHKPISTPASGPANWVLIGVTTIVVLFATRKAFR